MSIEKLRTEFKDLYAEAVKSDISIYNPEYVLWLEQKVALLEEQLNNCIVENNNSKEMHYD